MVKDIHTHLFTKDFGDLFLYGIDELLTYFYLTVETLKCTDISYDHFWNLSKREMANLVWDSLFIRNTPIIEALKGCDYGFKKMGMAMTSRDIDYYRNCLNRIPKEQYIDRVFNIAGIKNIIMTNDPFQEAERKVWLSGYKNDERFKASLRIALLLN